MHKLKLFYLKMSYIRKYPISILVILAVVYLSFFKPPHTDLERVNNIDKVAHICMYFGMSGMLWFEFLRSQRKYHAPMWHAWVGAFLCPILFSGLVEILQEYCTDYRGGDWMDFLANTIGVVLAALVACFIIRPLMLKKETTDTFDQ